MKFVSTPNLLIDLCLTALAGAQQRYNSYTVWEFQNFSNLFFLSPFLKDLAAINEMMRREVQPKSKVGKRLLADDQDSLNDPNAEQTSEPPAKMQLIMPGAMNARLSLVMTDRGQSD